MTDTLFVPDTTVLSNFALIKQMVVLEAIVNGRGAWCATVAAECSAGAQKPGLEEMTLANRIFGDPLYPSAAEHVDLLVLRDLMRQPGDRRTAHLGEAETITIISSRRLSAAFVTDDKDAQRQARSQHIPVYNTWHILKLAVKTKRLTEADFIVAYDILVHAHRGPPPCGRDRADVRSWLTGD